MRILWAQIHLTLLGPAPWSKSAGRSEVLSAQPWGCMGTLSFLHPESLWGQLKHTVSGFSQILAPVSKHCVEALLPYLSYSPKAAVDQHRFPLCWAHLTVLALGTLKCGHDQN